MYFVQLFHLDPQNNHSLINRHDMEACLISHHSHLLTRPHTHTHTYIWWQSCVVEFFSLTCNFSIWLCVFVVFLAVSLHWLSQTECWEMAGINSTDTNTLQWETETNRLWHLVIGKPIITEWFNHRLSACFCFFYIFIHHTLFIPSCFMHVVFLRHTDTKKSKFIPIFWSFFSQSKWLFAGFVVNPL